MAIPPTAPPAIAPMLLFCPRAGVGSGVVPVELGGDGIGKVEDEENEDVRDEAGIEALVLTSVYAGKAKTVVLSVPQAGLYHVSVPVSSWVHWQ